MNKKELKLKRNENWRKYHPTNVRAGRVKRNVVKPYPNNSWAHELAKFKICWLISKLGHSYITEGVSRKTGERVDVVDLDTGYHYEIETDPKRAKRFEGREDVIVVKLWEKKSLSKYIEE